MRTSPIRPVAMVAALILATVATASGSTAAGASPSQEATTSQETITSMDRLAVGSQHACGIDDTNALHCWGSDSKGQLGVNLGPDKTESYVPIAVTVAGTPLAGKTIAEVEAGNNTTCARATDDTLACWGENDRGQLGDGTTTDAELPVAVAVTGTPLDGADIVDIDMSYKHACAVTATGVAACWGLGSVGQLGHGANADALAPTAVSTDIGSALNGKAVARISAGAFSTCAVTTDGDPACWGNAFRGGLGNGATSGNFNKPISPTTAGTPLDGKEVDQITVGRYGVCATTTVGDLACWGAGTSGQIGNGGAVNVPTPTAATVTGTPLAGATVIGMDSGFDNHCAVTSTGNAACWGMGSSGTGTNVAIPTGLAVTGTVLDGVALDEIRSSQSGGCAVGANGQPGCWGTGLVRGAGSNAYSNAPTTVALRYGVPTSAPGFTSIGATGRQLQLEWNGVADHGGAEVTDITVKVFVNGGLVDTRFIGASGDGASNFFFSLQYDTTYQFTLTATNAAGDGPTSALSASVTTGSAPVEQSRYTPITPCRVVDTRQAGGVFSNREIRDYTVTGGGGVFAIQGGKPGGCAIPGGVEAVEASVTAVGPADSGFFRAWPTGESMPNATFMNFDQGMDITNTGAITINSHASAAATNGGGAGEVRARNFGGASHYVIDIQGYYGERDDVGDSNTEVTSLGGGPRGSQYVPISPCRIVDTRQAGGTLGNREIRDIAVTGDGPAFAAQGGVANGCDLPEGSVAVEASVTAVGPATSGFFRAWPTGESMPNATFMNFDQGMDITNTGAITINPVDNASQMRMRNFGGASHYVVDVQGYFIGDLGAGAEASGPSTARASSYVAITPCRIVDTRQAGGTLANREIRNLQVGGDGAVFAAQGGKANGCGLPLGAVAVEASVTAVDPADSGFFRAWPFGQSLPNATFMNFDQGMDITNTGSLTLGRDIDESGALTNAGMEHLRIRNYGGASHYVIDIQGYFIADGR